jgi:hypothetical protein
MDELQARKLIVEIGKLMYEKGYVTSSDGNISCRLDDNVILATPTQVSKGRMTEDMMALVDLDGNALNDRRMSSEIKMHLLFYNMRADVGAVCHAHTPHGTAFAAAGLSIDAPILSEVILTLGCVPLTAYGTPSTTELTDALAPFVAHHNAYCWKITASSLTETICGRLLTVSKLWNTRLKSRFLLKLSAAQIICRPTQSKNSSIFAKKAVICRKKRAVSLAVISKMPESPVRMIRKKI